VNTLRRRLALAVVLAAAPAPALVAQDGAAGPSFIIVRYASESALGMYSGYAAGPVLLVAGLLHNPRSEYQEVMGGAGHAFTMAGGHNVTLVGAAAYTDTGWYSQFYVVPSLRFGRLRIDATVQGAQPLTSRGTRAVYVSPGNVLYGVAGGFAVGAAYYGGAENGNSTSHEAGLAVQRAVPHGSVTAEFVKGIQAAKDEVRLTIRSSFE